MIICDKDYPQRVAFALINRVLEEFSDTYPREIWMSASKQLGLTSLPETIQKFQNPHEADAIMRVQKELDETKVILVHTYLLFSTFGYQKLSLASNNKFTS